MSITQDIKEFALDLGYTRVGITTAENFPGYVEELSSRPEMYGWYINGGGNPLPNARDPKSVLPEVKSIVVTVFDYAREAFPPQLLGKVARFYQARGYLSPKERINGSRRHLFMGYLEKQGMKVAQKLPAVPDRLAASRAGVTTYGKNNFAYINGAGSFIMITSFLVDKEMEYDAPTYRVDCPEDCQKCVEACPTGSLYQPLKMDPRRCIAYNCFMTQDAYAPSTSHFILPEIREKMGSWIHGCDICQDVCPRNQPRLKAELPPNEYLARVAPDFDLRRILNLADEYYQKRVQPLMYNYIRHKKYFQRNAAIALGNSGNPEYIPDLITALSDPEEIVRGYAAWGLGRIGGAKAKEALEKASKGETGDFVRKEMAAALEAVSR